MKLCRQRERGMRDQWLELRTRKRGIGEEIIDLWPKCGQEGGELERRSGTSGLACVEKA